jgi:hypothetical protein
MAIIKCPQCDNSISDKQKVCPHCELDMTNLTEEKIQSLSKLNRLKKNQALQTYQFVAMLLFLGGCYGYYNAKDTESPQYLLTLACILVGFVWYIVNRVLIILAKRRRQN